MVQYGIPGLTFDVSTHLKWMTDQSVNLIETLKGNTRRPIWT